MTAKKRVRPVVNLTLDPDLIEFIDREAENLGMTRSRLIENCLLIAVDDLKVLKKMGLLEAVKVIRGIQEKMKHEVFCATR